MDILPTESETKAGWGWMMVQLVLPGALTSAGAGNFLNPAQMNFLYYAINFGVVLFIFRRFLRWNFAAVKENPRGLFRTAAIALALFYLCDTLFNKLIFPAVPGFVNPNNDQIVALFSQGAVWMLPGTVVLAPLAEECFFRELIFHRLYEDHGWIAYPVSAAAFSAIHVLGFLGKAEPLVLLLCFVQYLPAGLLLCWAYAQTGTFAAPLLVHSIINAVSALMLS